MKNISEIKNILNLYDRDVINGFVMSIKLMNKDIFKDNVFYVLQGNNAYEIGKARNENTYKEIVKKAEKSNKLVFFIKMKMDVVIENQTCDNCTIYAVFNQNDLLQFTKDKDDWLIIEPQFQSPQNLKDYHYRAFNLISKKNKIT